MPYGQPEPGAVTTFNSVLHIDESTRTDDAGGDLKADCMLALHVETPYPAGYLVAVPSIVRTPECEVRTWTSAS